MYASDFPYRYSMKNKFFLTFGRKEMVSFRIRED